ncbi:hypothetical protein CPB85DRAFT_1326574 [Mucidula mucida]|nr:hypothetical protein CPB85DRAFT_1326574 [Mucidula mucida]
MAPRISRSIYSYPSAYTIKGDEQFQLIGDPGVSHVLRNVRYQTYIGNTNDNGVVQITTPKPWYINNTGDTDWWQISSNSNRGGPFWVGIGKSSETENGTVRILVFRLIQPLTPIHHLQLELSSGGYYSWYFLLVSDVTGSSSVSLPATPTSTSTSTVSSPSPTSSPASDGGLSQSDLISLGIGIPSALFALISLAIAWKKPQWIKRAWMFLFCGDRRREADEFHLLSKRDYAKVGQD